MTWKFSAPLTPRPPETTIAASVSSGRPVDSRGRAGDDLGAGGLLAEGHGELLDGAGGRSGLGSGGVGLDGDDRGALGDAGLGGEGGGEHGLRGHRALVAGLQVDGVGDDAGADAHREAGGDLLALGGGGDQDGGRGDRVVGGLQRVHLRARRGSRRTRGRRRPAPSPRRARRASWRPPRRRGRGARRPGRRCGGPGSAARGWACGRRRPRGRRRQGLQPWELLLRKMWGGWCGRAGHGRSARARSDELLAPRGSRRAACRPRPRP